MVGRRLSLHEDGKLPVTRKNLGGKGAVHHDGGGEGVDGEAFPSDSRTASLNSLATSADEQNNAHFSASSTGNTELSSSALSTNSTARTSAMSDDRPSASSPMSPSPHAHPAVTVLELVSNTVSSSALPDSFSFNVSRKGNYVAVYTASNIWLIKAAQLPRLWARTLEVKRKPVAIDITEDGFLLAVLSRPSQVDLYEIHGEADRQIKKRRTIMLVHEASSLVLSPDGLILIAGNKFGIEVFAVGPDAPETLRRSLSGPVGDTLEFSDDCRTLLITSYARSSTSSSVFILPGLYDGPLNDEGVPLPASPETVWTGTVLFPETARIARQATLLPDADTGQVNELFAFNAEDDTWGVYDIAGQRFTQRKMFLPDQQRWTRSEFVDDAMPAVSPNADLVAVALRMRGTTSIWLYQIPEWDQKPISEKIEQSPIQPCFCIPIVHENDSYQEISLLRWVRLNSNVQRLVAVGNLSIAPTESEGPGIPSSSKGVIVVFDFDRTKTIGGVVPVPVKTEYDLDPLCPGERLPEGLIDFDREVELVRTRTVAQRRAQDRAGNTRRNSRTGLTPGRASTTVNQTRPTTAQLPIPTITHGDEEGLTMEEAQAAFEVPYDNQQPRSQMSLARAATVAAVSPANRRHLRALPFRPLEYRRADGQRELPHESDADNWVPPPPIYTATAEASNSVSLSHPNAPPLPATMVPVPGSTVPPVPPPPPSMLRPQHVATNVYQARGSFQSHSSVDLTLALPQERRPSLLHPQTYPSPQAAATGRRRSSTSQSSQRHMSIAQPPMPIVQPQNYAEFQVPVTSSHTRRPTFRSRRGFESSVDLRPPPTPVPAQYRRGSAPDTSIHRRPVPVPAHDRRQSIHNGPPTRQNPRRAMLPRSSTVGDSVPHPGPLSAPPPRTETATARTHAHMRSEAKAGGSEKSRSMKKKSACAVM